MCGDRMQFNGLKYINTSVFFCEISHYCKVFWEKRIFYHKIYLFLNY
jgi:hypothetical protein